MDHDIASKADIARLKFNLIWDIETTPYLAR